MEGKTESSSVGNLKSIDLGGSPSHQDNVDGDENIFSLPYRLFESLLEFKIDRIFQRNLKFLQF